MDLLNDKVGKLYLKFLGPAVGGTLVSAIYLLGDAILIGQGIGETGMSGLASISPALTLLFSIGLLFGVGGSVMYNVFMAQKDTQKARSYFTLSVIWALILTTIFMTFSLIFVDDFIIALRATEESFQGAKDYFFYMMCCAPIFTFSAMLQVFIRADKNPNLCMIGVIVGAVTNLVLDYVFIFILEMGMKGGSIATCIGTVVQLSIFLTHFLKKNNNLKFTKIFHFGKKSVHIIQNGFPSFLVDFGNGILVLFFNFQILKYLGESSHAVYASIMNMALLFMVLFNGVGQATQPIISSNHGAKQTERVKTVFKYGLFTVLGLGAVASIICMSAPASVVKLFIPSENFTEELNKIATTSMRLYAISFFFMAINLFFCSYLQSTLRSAFAISVSMFRGFIMPIILLFTLPLASPGITLWLVMPIVEITTLILLLGVFFGTRKKINNPLVDDGEIIEAV